MLCLLLNVEWGRVALVTTDLLLPTIYDFDLIRTLKYLRVYLNSIICSVAVLAATNSDPYVALSTVTYFLEYQSVGVWLQKWRHAVSDAPVSRQWRRLASRVVVLVIDFPRVLRQLFGHDSLNIAINCVRPVIFHVREIVVVSLLISLPG